MDNRSQKAKSSWFRDLLVLPLIVGVTVVLVTFLLPRLLDGGKELTYEIKEPVAFLSEQVLGTLNIKVNDIETSRLYAIQVHLKNSGMKPLTDLPVRFVFDTTSKDFRIFNIVHDTKPKYEFGDIKVDERRQNSVRLIYKLLNHKDEDLVTFLANEDKPLAVYAKAPALRLKQETAPGVQNWTWILAMVAAVASLFTTLVYRYTLQKKQEMALEETRKSIRDLGEMSSSSSSSESSEY